MWRSMINRPQYIQQLVGFKDKQIIKILTGIRRCGKSTLLEMYQQHLLAQGVDRRQLISLNFEDYDHEALLDPKALYAHLKKLLNENAMNYIFLDEIQLVRDFQKVVDSLYIKKNVDLYLTGSNARILSGELATLLSGRYVEIEILPLSFKEYVGAAEGTGGLSHKYREYLTQSSFPYTPEFKGNQKQINDYLRGIYSTVILKDVMGRFRIADPMMLESVVKFVFDNIGNQLSTKKISDYMSTHGRKIDVKTVEKYIKGLMDSYIVYQAKRYNIKGKSYLKTLEKYYVVDIGLRNMLLGNQGTDVGHILENVVYLELLRRGYDVYIGKVDEQEVDFVAMDSDGLTYYQVSATVRAPETFEREIAPLKRITDAHPKYILTLDDDAEANFDGIKRVNALDWLMQ